MNDNEFKRLARDSERDFEYKGCIYSKDEKNRICLDEKFSREEDIEIPEGVTEIGEYAFSRTNIRYVKLPDSLLEINECAFNLCFNLTDVKFGKGPVVIYPRAFYHCNRLASIDLENVLWVGDYSFSDCYNLQNIKLHEGLKYIGECAFFGCYEIDKIILPASIMSLEKGSLGHVNEIVIKGKHIPSKLLLSVSRFKEPFTYTVQAGRSKLIIPTCLNKSVYPKAIEYLSEIDMNENKTVVLYNWAETLEDRQKIAYEGYEQSPDPKTKSYLRKYAINMLKQTETEEDFISLFNGFIAKNLMTKNVAEKSLPVAQEENWTQAAAFVLEYLKKYTKTDSQKDKNNKFNL